MWVSLRTITNRPMARWSASPRFQPPIFPWSGEPSELPAVDHWLRRSKQVWDATQQKIQADRHRCPFPTLRPGQRVWLSTQDLQLRLPCQKLSPRYVGPFKIVKQVNAVTYKLLLPSHYRISPMFPCFLVETGGRAWSVAVGGSCSSASSWARWPDRISGPLSAGFTFKELTHVLPVRLGGLRTRGVFLGSSQWHPG